MTTASTRPAIRLGTAENPIVTRRTERGSPPPARTTASSTASSEGRPVTPTRAPTQIGRAANAGPGDHRGQRMLHDRADADYVGSPLTGQAEVVDVDDRKVGPPAERSLSESVELAGVRIASPCRARGPVVAWTVSMPA